MEKSLKFSTPTIMALGSVFVFIYSPIFRIPVVHDCGDLNWPFHSSLRTGVLTIIELAVLLFIIKPWKENSALYQAGVTIAVLIPAAVIYIFLYPGYHCLNGYSFVHSAWLLLGIVVAIIQATIAGAYSIYVDRKNV